MYCCKTKNAPQGVLLSGYYGFENAGDEALLQAAVQTFKSQHIPVAVLSHKPDVTTSQLGIPAFKRKKIIGILRGIKQAKVVLSGGGGLLQDATSLKSLTYYLQIPVLAKLFRKKTMIFAQGIGPIKTPKGKWLTRWVCEKFIDKITVRDEDSKKVLESLGVKKKIEVTADLAFLLPSPSHEEAQKMANRFGLNAVSLPFFGVVLRTWKGMEKLLPAISHAISEFSKTQHVVPVLLSFQPGEEKELFLSLHRQLDIQHVNITEPLSPQELLALMANFKFTLGMRYHALIFSALSFLPFLGIAYDPKVENFARFLKFPYLRLEELSQKELLDALFKTWNEVNALGKILQEQIPLLKKKAEQNVEAVLELLEKRTS